MQKQLGIMADEIKQVEGMVVSQQMNPSSVIDYKVQLLEAST